MLKETKEYLKKLAVEIRENKNCRKLSNCGNRKLSEIEYTVFRLKYEFRHYHIAYCELRGRTREQIEIPSKSNPANQVYIDKIKKGIVKTYEEQQTLCDCA